MAVDKILGASYSSVSKVLGTAKASISKIDGVTAAGGGGGGGDVTISLMAEVSDLKTDSNNTAADDLRSANDDGTNDARFSVAWNSEADDVDYITSTSESTTLAIGSANSKAYLGVRFSTGFADGSGNVDNVQIRVDSVGTSADYHVEIYANENIGSGPPYPIPSKPGSQNGGSSDTVSIATGGTEPRTISFTWSSNEPSLTNGTKYWIVFVDES
jgi:hypothetical protein